MRGITISILVSALLFAVFAVVMTSFVTNQIRSTSSQAGKESGTAVSTTDPTQLVGDVKTQADFKNIQTSLIIYYSEFGYYPPDLNELVSSGYLSETYLTNIDYTRCSSDIVVVRKGNAGFKLENEHLVNGTTC
jgi:hypothetical protein